MTMHISRRQNPNGHLQPLAVSSRLNQTASKSPLGQIKKLAGKASKGLGRTLSLGRMCCMRNSVPSSVYTSPPVRYDNDPPFKTLTEKFTTASPEEKLRFLQNNPKCLAALRKIEDTFLEKNTTIDPARFNCFLVFYNQYTQLADMDVDLCWMLTQQGTESPLALLRPDSNDPLPIQSVLGNSSLAANNVFTADSSTSTDTASSSSSESDTHTEGKAPVHTTSSSQNSTVQTRDLYIEDDTLSSSSSSATNDTRSELAFDASEIDGASYFRISDEHDSHSSFIQTPLIKAVNLVLERIKTMYPGTNDDSTLSSSSSESDDKRSVDSLDEEASYWPIPSCASNEFNCADSISDASLYTS